MAWPRRLTPHGFCMTAKGMGLSDPHQAAELRSGLAQQVAMTGGARAS